MTDSELIDLFRASDAVASGLLKTAGTIPDELRALALDVIEATEEVLNLLSEEQPEDA